MSIDILIIVAITSFIQSIFGVGVLLYGTPLLLLQGYSFIYAVTILLPISIVINLFQISKDYKSIDFGFYKNILIYSIPVIVIFLSVVINFTINIDIIIGIFLIFVSAKNYHYKVNKVINSLIRYEKVYFIIMGIVHGLTNLGGAFLAAIIHSKGYEKHITRVTIGASYATFAFFQILTLLVFNQRIDITLWMISIYLFVSILIYIITEKTIFIDIDNYNYHIIFTVLLFITGVLLLIKSI